jgi:hypothetical protein
MIRQCDVCFLHVVLHAGDFLSVKQTGRPGHCSCHGSRGWLDVTNNKTTCRQQPHHPRHSDLAANSGNFWLANSLSVAYLLRSEAIALKPPPFAAKTTSPSPHHVISASEPPSPSCHRPRHTFSITHSSRYNSSCFVSSRYQAYQASLDGRKGPTGRSYCR